MAFTASSNCSKSNKLMVSSITLLMADFSLCAIFNELSESVISESNTVLSLPSFVASSMDNSNLKSLKPLKPRVRQKRTKVASPTSKWAAISAKGACTARSGFNKIASAIFFSVFVKLRYNELMVFKILPFLAINHSRIFCL